MRLTNLTRENEIGANSYLLETSRSRLLLDSGMHPKREGRAALPDLALIGRDPLDGIVLTHAHHDHIGSVPVAQRQSPGTKVYLTELTALLADAMLHNSVNVMSSQREELGITDYPFFTHKEVEEAVLDWIPLRMRRPVQVGEDCTIEFFDAGHIPGSAGVRVMADGRSVFYTGDVQFEDQSFCIGADFPREHVDVLDHGNDPRGGGPGAALHAAHRDRALCLGVQAGLRARRRGVGAGVRARQDAGVSIC